jgi:hypothetical protein
MQKELRRNSTNSSDDSKGHSLGLEGDQFLYLIVAIVLGIVILLAGMKSGMSPGSAILLAIIPIPLAVIYLLTFKINKPAGYQADLFQKWSGNTSITRGEKKKNPYLLAKQGKNNIKSKTFVFFK